MALAELAAKWFPRLAETGLAKLSEEALQTSKNAFLKFPQYARNYVEGEPILTFLQGGEPELKSGYQKLMNTIHSSDYVMNKTPGGRKIVSDFALADIGERNFIEAHLSKFEEATKGIKKLTPESRNTFLALENRLPVEQLTVQEKKAFDFTKGQFDFLGKQYTEFLAKGREGYNAVVRMNQSGRSIDDVPDELKEAYEFYSRLRKHYAPHIFNKDEYLDYATKHIDDLAGKAQLTKDPRKIEDLGSKIKVLEDSIKRFQGGDPLAYESLPKEFIFRSQLQRKGAVGFSEDIVSQYRRYVFDMAKKTYTDDAVKRAVTTYYNELPMEQRQYAKWFIRDFAGYNSRSAWDEIAGKVAGVEYVRTLGFNFRSPIANLTQQFNTIADVGPKWAMKGYLKAFTEEGKVLWERSGLHVEAPTALTEDLSPTASWLEKVKRVTGYFFNLAENANRRHALSSYYEKYISQGMSEEDSLRRAIDGVHKTQFLYGRVGMPKVLRTAAGRVGLQYSSFTIKQLEFLHNLAKEDPVKFIGWVGMTTGSNYTVGQALGIDLSGVLGFGVNFGEALEMLRSASHGDLEETWAHGKLAFAEGSGILPSGFGPAASGVMKIGTAISKGEKVGETLYRELTPVATQRAGELIRSISNRQLAKEPGTLPRISPTGEYLYDLPAYRLLLGPAFRPKIETEKSKRLFMSGVYDQLDSKRKRIIAEAIANGNVDKAKRLVGKWNVMPEASSIREQMMRKTLPREQRKKYIQREQRQLVREQVALSKEVEEAEEE